MMIVDRRRLGRLYFWGSMEGNIAVLNNPYKFSLYFLYFSLVLVNLLLMNEDISFLIFSLLYLKCHFHYIKQKILSYSLNCIYAVLNLRGAG